MMYIYITVEDIAYLLCTVVVLYHPTHHELHIP